MELLAQRDDDVARLERPAGGAGQQRRVEHEVDVVDQRDVRAVGGELAFEAARDRQAAEAAAEDEHVPGHGGPRLPVGAGSPTTRPRCAARPRAGRAAAKAAATSSASARSSPEAIRRAGGRRSRRATSSRSGRTRLAHTVGAHGPGARRRSQRTASTSGAPLAAAARAVAATASGSTSQADNGSVAQARGRDGQHAGAAAPVGERAARLEVQQELEAQPRRVVRARAEGRAGLDHEVDAAPRRARSHGGRTRTAPAAAARVDGTVERLPALRPVLVGQLGRGHGHERVARRGPQLAARRAARPARRRARTRRRRRRARAPPGRPGPGRAAPPARPPRRRGRRARPAGSRPLQEQRGPLRALPATRFAEAVARVGRRGLVRAPASTPEATSRSGGRSSTSPAISSCSSAVRLASTVGAQGGSVAARLSQCVRTATPLAAALARMVASASGSTSTAATGSQPSRAAATASTPLPEPQSHSGAGRLQLEQQLQAQLRRRVAARPERGAGIDHELEVGRRRGRLRRPRRPDAQPRAPAVTSTGRWYCVPAPLPAVGDVGQREVDSASPAAARMSSARGSSARGA